MYCFIIIVFIKVINVLYFSTNLKFDFFHTNIDKKSVHNCYIFQCKMKIFIAKNLTFYKRENNVQSILNNKITYNV